MEKLRAHSQSLPKGKDNVIALVKRVLGLSGVQEIRIRPNEFFVERLMPDDDTPVLPKEVAVVPEIELDFLLAKIEANNELHSGEFSPETHPYVILERVTHELSGIRNLVVCGMIAPVDMVSAYFDLDNEDPPTVMGIKMLYTSEEKYADKLVVLGGPTVYIADATHGIIIDMGV
jgi:hypothetical protein